MVMSLSGTCHIEKDLWQLAGEPDNVNLETMSI